MRCLGGVWEWKGGLVNLAVRVEGHALEGNDD